VSSIYHFWFRRTVFAPALSSSSIQTTYGSRWNYVAVDHQTVIQQPQQRRRWPSLGPIHFPKSLCISRVDIRNDRMTSCVIISGGLKWDIVNEVSLAAFRLKSSLRVSEVSNLQACVWATHSIRCLSYKNCEQPYNSAMMFLFRILQPGYRVMPATRKQRHLQDMDGTTANGIRFPCEHRRGKQ